MRLYSNFSRIAPSFNGLSRTVNTRLSSGNQEIILKPSGLRWKSLVAHKHCQMDKLSLGCWTWTWRVIEPISIASVCRPQVFPHLLCNSRKRVFSVPTKTSLTTIRSLAICEVSLVKYLLWFSLRITILWWRERVFVCASCFQSVYGLSDYERNDVFHPFFLFLPLLWIKQQCTLFSQRDLSQRKVANWTGWISAEGLKLMTFTSKPHVLIRLTTAGRQIILHRTFRKSVLQKSFSSLPSPLQFEQRLTILQKSRRTMWLARFCFRKQSIS